MIRHQTYEMNSNQSDTKLQLYLSIETVAKILDCSEQFLRNLIRDRRIGYVKVGRLVRIPESEIIQLIQSYPSLDFEIMKELKDY